MPTINLPVFQILYDDINNLPGGIPSDKPKLLLKPHFTDLNNPTQMKLLAYFTKTHGKYAEDEVPQNIISPVTGLTATVDSNLAIGNNDLTIKRLLKKHGGQNRVWAKIHLVPVARRCNAADPVSHLAFKIEFYETLGGPVQIDVDPVISNPSPPAKPSDEELQP